MTLGGHMPDGKAERPQTRPFSAFLQEQRDGLLHAELSDQLATLAAAVSDTNKAGTLTLTIKVKPSKVFGALEVEDDLKVKPPQSDRGAAIFFADEHGNLSRRDPRQPQLPGVVRDVSAPPAGVDPATGEIASTGTEG